MSDLTTEVTVTIHGTEIDLIAEGDRICPAEPDVGIMRNYIDGCVLYFADGTLVPWGLLEFLSQGESDKVLDALNEALARGDFEPDPDRLREERDEIRRLGWTIDENPFKAKQS